MKVITIAGPKGGTGKSTVCASLAVRATLETGRVALIDLDAQGTLSEFWVLRGKPARWCSAALSPTIATACA
jgi:cellulose biosynthesis protein BcsQ